jgi:hypothetical protein
MDSLWSWLLVRRCRHPPEEAKCRKLGIEFSIFVAASRSSLASADPRDVVPSTGGTPRSYRRERLADHLIAGTSGAMAAGSLKLPRFIFGVTGYAVISSAGN